MNKEINMLKKIIDSEGKCEQFRECNKCPYTIPCRSLKDDIIREVFILTLIHQEMFSPITYIKSRLDKLLRKEFKKKILRSE